MIVVEKLNDQEFTVTVEEGTSKTQHKVTLDQKYYQQLTKGKITKEQLISKSFEFLLKREPRESILSQFNLKVISRYFSEYERVIVEA